MHDANGKGAAGRSVTAPVEPGAAGEGFAGETPAASRRLSVAAPWGVAAAVLAVAAAVLHWAVPGYSVAAAGLAALALAALFALAWAVGRAGAGNPVAELLLAAAEDGAEGRLITAPDGRVVYANPAFRRLFAVAPAGRREDAVSLEAVAAHLAGGEEEAEDFARLRASAAAGIARQAEVRLRMPSGAVEWRRISVRPVAGGRGHALWRARDVTADRELEAVRRGEEEMLADFLDQLPVGFFSADAEGRILYANQTLARWLGALSGEMGLTGCRFADFVVDGKTAPAGGGAAGDAAPHMHGDVTLRDHGGATIRACLVQSEHADADGNMVYSRSVVLRDLAWRDAGAERGSHQRLHWLFTEAPVGIVLLDVQGVVTECNRAFLKFLGVHREAVVGRTFSEHIGAEDQSEAAAQLTRVVKGAARSVHLEVRMPGSRGRELSAALYGTRMEDADANILGLVLHCIDTTEQKDLEIRFAQSQKMQAVGQLAGGIAHDFNNLLTAMIGFSDLLLERHGADDPSFSDIMQIRHNANRATNLVRQLLAFSRQQVLQPVVLDATEALSDLASLLRRLIGETIDLKMEHGRDLGAAKVDRGQFDQMIINLAVNARDAMPGGGTLTIRTSNAAVAAPVQRGSEVLPAGEYLLIEVADTGAGIARETIEHIFEPFFTTKGVGAGTGLGLSTVYGIVRQTGGVIFVDSAPGEGATFKIYLPRHVEPSAEATTGAAAGRAAVARPARPDEPAGEADLTGVGTVLLVEDEAAVRMFGARALRNKGYKVLEADNGEGALEVIGSAGRPIDLIISDVVMPGMDGHTLIKRVRREMPHVKVILMSGYAEDVSAAEIERDPTIHFLAKPFTLKGLAGKVKELMAG
ncbi:MAG: PAS domain-containing protein [Rhodospirillales bacterium]